MHILDGLAQRHTEHIRGAEGRKTSRGGATSPWQGLAEAIMELGLEPGWAPPVICMQHSMGAPNTPAGPQGHRLLVQAAAEEREVEARLGGCPTGSTGLGGELRQERPRRNSYLCSRMFSPRI